MGEEGPCTSDLTLAARSGEPGPLDLGASSESGPVAVLPLPTRQIQGSPETWHTMVDDGSV